MPDCLRSIVLRCMGWDGMSILTDSLDLTSKVSLYIQVSIYTTYCYASTLVLFLFGHNTQPAFMNTTNWSTVLATRTSLSLKAQGLIAFAFARGRVRYAASPWLHAKH